MQDQITPSASLEGQVLDKQKRLPLSNMTILIVDAAGPVPDILPITDSDGRFALDALPSGPLTIQIGDIKQTVILKPNEITNVLLLV